METLQRTGTLLAFGALVAFAWLTSENFATWSNLRIVLLQSSLLLIVAVPLAMLMMAGHVDLSVGATMALVAVVAGQLWETAGPFTAVAVAIIASLTVGIFNGALCTYVGFSPILVTLGGLTAIRGLANQISGGVATTSFGDAFGTFGRGSVLTIPYPVLYAGIIFVLGAAIFRTTSWGRHIRAIGASPKLSYLSGVNTRRLPFVLYIFTALLAGLGGLVQMSRLDSVAPTLGLGFELHVLTAILLGGVAFGGGGGSMLGVLVGVMFLGILNNTLILNGVSPFWFQVASGTALVLAAGLNVLSRRLAGRNRSSGSAESGGPSVRLRTEGGDQ